MRLVFVHPEIPQNVGTLIRVSACWRVPLDIVGPLSFVWSDQRMKRAHMDYSELSSCTVHESWDTFKMNRPSGRVLALVPRRGQNYATFSFWPADAIMVGSESCGFSPEIESDADALLHIPMAEGARSLNVAIAASVVLAAALSKQGWKSVR